MRGWLTVVLFVSFGFSAAAWAVPPGERSKSPVEFQSCGFWEGRHVVFTNSYGNEIRVPDFRVECYESGGQTIMRFMRMMERRGDYDVLETRVHDRIGFVLMYRNLFAYSYSEGGGWYVWGNYRGTSGPYQQVHCCKDGSGPYQFAYYFKKDDFTWYQSTLFMSGPEYRMGKELAQR